MGLNLKKLQRDRKRRRSTRLSLHSKSPAQIAGIWQSCRLASETLAHVSGFVRVGVTTGELDKIAESFIRSHRALPAPLGYHGYPKSICVSVNEVVCHGLPGDLVLKDGDIVNVDVTTILDGYYGDTSRMIPVGEVNLEASSLMNAAYSSLMTGIAQVRTGNFLGNIGYAIAHHVEPMGYSVVTSFCGHGVGLAFHEDLKVFHKADRDTGPVMQPGMIFTIEPMINAGSPETVIGSDGWTVRTKDGRLSAQYEHTVLVTETGCLVLTG